MEDLNASGSAGDASRDEYVRGLHAQLKGLQVPLEPELMRKEVSRLNAQLRRKMDDCAEARRELAAARSARDGEALERVQMLEQQVRPRHGRQGAGPPSPPGAGRGLLMGSGRGFLRRAGPPPGRRRLLQILAYKDDFTSERPMRERGRRAGIHASWRSRWPRCSARCPGDRYSRGLRARVGVAFISPLAPSSSPGRLC